MVRFLRRLGSFAPVSYPRNLASPWLDARPNRYDALPYVGLAAVVAAPRWGEWPNRLLVVALGVGKDEPPGRI